MRLGIDVARTVVMVCGLLAAVGTAMGQSLVVRPILLDNFIAHADSLNLDSSAWALPQMVSVTAVDGSNVPFKFAGAVTASGKPNFVVVSPSSGVTPALLFVALNRNVVPYLPAGTYGAALQFAASGQSCPSCVGTSVTLRLVARPAPTITAVVNAATLQPGISPGAIISILGTNLSTPPVSAQYDSGGLYPTALGNTSVTFSGATAPLLYVSTDRIDAVVPYGVAGQRTVDVVISHNLHVSPAFSVPLLETSPGIFTATGNGTGHVILNANSTPNSVDNPAPKGSVIQIFATGAGVWNQNPQDGRVILSAIIDIPLVGGYVLLRPVAPVSLTIGGQPAQILYAGPAPYEVSGKLQVNAVVPDGVGSGPQPVVLTIGNNSNSQQQVTVAVQ
jgi:uncharacterized protein (TIGR03437 family)